MSFGKPLLLSLQGRFTFSSLPLPQHAIRNLTQNTYWPKHIPFLKDSDNLAETTDL
jgi:hypothetical protein